MIKQKLQANCLGDSPCNLISQACWGWCKIESEEKALWWFMLTVKYPEVWRFHHTVVINRRRMLVWYLAIARIKGSQSRVAVISQWAALFLLYTPTHSFFSSNQHRAFETSHVFGQTARIMVTRMGAFFKNANPIGCWIFSLLKA